MRKRELASHHLQKYLRVGLATAILLGFVGSIRSISAQTTRASRSAPSESQSRFATLDRVRVHYTSAGRGREALVFVHGWMCNLNFWRLQAPAFARRMRVIAIDLPGHGQSDKPRIAYTQDLFARAVDAVLRDAGVRRAVLVGHSMGTPVVRQFYRHCPQKVLALVIVDGALRPFAPREAMERFITPLRGENYRAVASRMVDGMLGEQMPASLRNEIRSAMLDTPQHVALSAVEGTMDETIWRQDHITVPVLAVLARSPAWPPDNEQFYRRIAPQIEYQMWDGVSHFLMMERPEEFNRMLMNFLVRNGFVRG